MKAYTAFVKKEFCEITRTYKLLILMLIFLIFGMMSPVTAKIMPKMINSFMTDGMKIIMPEPTVLDSWAQFFKNVSQMGFVILIIVFSGIMANEFSKGTLIIVLTKGLWRRTVIFSKFTAACIVWTGAYILSFAVSYAYTLYFWKDSTNNYNLIFSVFCLWLFGILLISTIIFGGVLFNSNYGCLLFVCITIGIQFLLNIIPKVQKYNPISLASNNMSLLKGQLKISDFTVPIIIAVALIIIFLISACAVFDKKKL
ncbi:MAG: ABC transporter permease [Bacillota bacterium]|nr:ABC transporter permease [Bacillota bacterium]